MTLTKEKFRVLCVDDHLLLADGLASRVNLEPTCNAWGALQRPRTLAEHVKHVRRMW